MLNINKIKKRTKMTTMPTIKEEEEVPQPFTFNDVVNYRADEIEILDKKIVYEGKHYEVLTDISFQDEFIILSNDNHYEWLVKTSAVRRVLGKKVSIWFV